MYHDITNYSDLYIVNNLRKPFLYKRTVLKPLWCNFWKNSHYVLALTWNCWLHFPLPPWKGDNNTAVSKKRKLTLLMALRRWQLTQNLCAWSLGISGRAGGSSNLAHSGSYLPPQTIFNTRSVNSLIFTGVVTRHPRQFCVHSCSHFLVVLVIQQL